MLFALCLYVKFELTAWLYCCEIIIDSCYWDVLFSPPLGLPHYYEPVPCL